MRYLLSLLFFVAIIIIGVNITTGHFNKIVMPDQELKAFELVRDQDILQVALVGETLEVNLAALRDKGTDIAQTASGHWHDVRTNPKINENFTDFKKTAVDKWDLLVNSAKVRAVNRWVKEKVQPL